MMKNKKGLGWMGWILIVLILIGAGIGAYFWLTGDSSSVVNGIPQPPALPA